MATQPTYQAGSSGHSVAVTTQTVTLPSGSSAGDLIVFAIFFSGDPGSVTDPAGWWFADSVTQGTNLHGRLYAAVISGASNPVISWATARICTYVAARISGAWPNAGVAWNWHNNGSVATITTPGGAIQDVAGLGLDLVGHASTVGITPPAGVTERIDVSPAEGPNASLNTVDASIDGEFGGRNYGVGVAKNTIAFTVIAQPVLPTQNTAPSLRGSAQTAAGSGVSATVNTPAGVANGDLLVAAIDWASDPGTVTAPAGWSLLRTDTVQMHTRIYTKLASGEGASSAWSWVNSRRYTIAVTAWSRVDRNTPVNAHGFASGTAANIVQPAVMPTLADCVLLAWYANDYTTYADTAPGGAQTELWDINNSTAHTEGAWQVFRDANTATGTRTFVHASGNGNVHAYQLAIAPAVTQAISAPTSVPTAGSVPAPKLSRRIAPNSVATRAAVPAPTITQTGGTQALTGVGAVASSQSVPGPTLSRGPVTVAPPALASPAVVATPSVSVGPVLVAPTSIPTAGSIPAVAVTTRVGVAAGSIGTGVQIGAPTLARGTVTIGVGSIAAAAHVADPTVSAGQVLIAPASVSTASAIPGSALATGPVAISPAGIGGAEVIASPSVEPATVAIVAAAIGSGAQTPMPAVTPGTVGLIPAGIAPSSVVASPELATGSVVVSAASSGSAAVVPVPGVEPGSVLIAVDVLASAADVASPTVTAGAAAIQPASVPTGATVGAGDLGRGPVTIIGASVAGAASVGAPDVVAGTVSARPVSIATAASIPAASITVAGAAIQPASITSEVVVQLADVSRGPVVVSPAGIASTQTTPPVSVTANATLAVASVASGANIPAPAVTAADVALTPASITTADTVAAPTVTTNSVVAPASTTSTNGVPAVAVTTRVDVAPAGVASTATIGGATIATSWVIRPSAVASVAAVGLPELFPILVLRPSPISAVLAVAAPTVTGRLRDLALTVREPTYKWQTSKLGDTWRLDEPSGKWVTGRVGV